MQITDDMVERALNVFSPREWYRRKYRNAVRAALEAALGARRGDASELPAKLRNIFPPLRHDCVDAADCIEDLTAALKKTNARLYRLCKCDPESGCRDAALREENSATLEKWGLK